MHPLRYGPHWSVLGFQSDDPVSDLRCVFNCKKKPVLFSSERRPLLSLSDASTSASVVRRCPHISCCLQNEQPQPSIHAFNCFSIRGSGMLGLLQLLWLLSSEDALPGWCVINRCWREQRGTEVDSFPLAIVSINFTCIAFDAFARGKLAAQIESAHSSGTQLSALHVSDFLSFFFRCFLAEQIEARLRASLSESSEFL